MNNLTVACFSLKAKLADKNQKYVELSQNDVNNSAKLLQNLHVSSYVCFNNGAMTQHWLKSISQYKNFKYSCRLLF